MYWFFPYLKLLFWPSLLTGELWQTSNVMRGAEGTNAGSRHKKGIWHRSQERRKNSNFKCKHMWNNMYHGDTDTQQICVCVCVYVHVYILNEPKYGGKNWNVSDTVQLSGSWRTSLGQNVILDFIVQHCCLWVITGLTEMIVGPWLRLSLRFAVSECWPLSPIT